MCPFSSLQMSKRYYNIVISFYFLVEQLHCKIYQSQKKCVAINSVVLLVERDAVGQSINSEECAGLFIFKLSPLAL